MPPSIPMPCTCFQELVYADDVPLHSRRVRGVDEAKLQRTSTTINSEKKKAQNPEVSTLAGCSSASRRESSSCCRRLRVLVAISSLTDPMLVLAGAMLLRVGVLEATDMGDVFLCPDGGHL